MYAGYDAVLLFARQGEKTMVDRLNSNSRARVNLWLIAGRIND